MDFHQVKVNDYNQLIGATITQIHFMSGTDDYDQETVPRFEMTAQDGQKRFVYVHAMGNTAIEAQLTIMSTTNKEATNETK